jgi:hypothetical protein
VMTLPHMRWHKQNGEMARLNEPTPNMR